MSIQRDHAPETRPSGAPPYPVFDGALQVSPATVLQRLQRDIGNRAMGRLLASSRPPRREQNTPSVPLDAKPSSLVLAGRSTRSSALSDTAIGAGGPPAASGLIGHLARRSREDRNAVIADLNARMGNRQLARMIALQRSSEPDPHRGPTPDELKAAGRNAVRELEAELDRVVESVEDIVRETPGRDVPRPSPSENARSRQSGSPPARRGRSIRTPIQPGSRKDRAHRRRWVREQLQEIAQGKGEHANRASRALDQLNELERELEVAKRDLALGHRHAPHPHGTNPSEHPDTPRNPRFDSSPKGKSTPNVSGTPEAPAAGAPTAASAPEARAGLAGGVTAAEEEALKAEGRLVKGVGFKGPSAAGRVAGKVGAAAGWIADFLMPGPLDALFLMVQFAGVYAEVREAKRSEGMRIGFAEGLVAGLLGLSRRWVREHLAPKAISRDVATQVAGTEGVRENGEIQGLAAGHSFAERLDRAQRRTLLHGHAVPALRAKHQHVDLRAWWEAGYSRDNVIDLAMALMPAVDAILEESAKNQALKEAAAKLKKETGYAKKYGLVVALPMALLVEMGIDLPD
jgi:hypothetical protein